MASKDRKSKVIASASFNGIDFVEVAANQTDLRVHFLNDVPLNNPAVNGILTVTITGGESIPVVTVKDQYRWSHDGNHFVLDISVAAPGDFSNYTLTITSSRTLSGLDPYFSWAVFSFKVLCPSDLDCQATPAVCPSPAADSPPIDYLAKDFLSFRQALLDFSASRYPEWQERSEADFGVMFLEALCSVADDLSYTQDRIAAEAALETATQRRSVVRHARLVDYWPQPARSAHVLLQFNVEAGAKIADGTVVTARGPDGTPIPFETGPGLAQRGQTLPVVAPAWNSGIQPYWFDDSQRCLPAGATQMFIFGSGYNFQPGQMLLIDTQPQSSADAPVGQIVTLVQVKELCDPLYDPGTFSGPKPPVLNCPGLGASGTAVTQLVWGSDDALTVEHDLTGTTLAGNLIAASQGQTQPAETFTIPPLPAQSIGVQPATVRTGPNDAADDPSLQFLYTLQTAPLAWLQPGDATQPPEMVFWTPEPDDTPVLWNYQRWLLDAEPFAQAFTIDAARYTRMAGSLGAPPQYEYDGDAGDTIRFGDGTFGGVPSAGTQFNVLYRTTAGAAGNVLPGTITSLQSKVAGVISVTNPLAAQGGADAESLDSVTQQAPQAFRAVQYRAVLPADYQTAAQTLPWVLRAGTVFRWTGSWLTVFTTPEPIATEQVASDDRLELINLLNRYRMTGYESYVPDPTYLSLDLIVELCAQPTAFQSNIEQALLTVLGTAPGQFFHHSNFTFGQPLELSVLEATIQGVNGVAGITCVRYRIRGRTNGFVRMLDTVNAGLDEILRCDNDPSLPNNGSLQVIIQGGR